jgi:glycosyltransferase involved in cell wall biosynthesis
MFLGTYDLTRGYGPTVPTACAADVVWTHAVCNVDEIATLGIPRARVAVVAYRGVDLQLFAEPVTIKAAGRIVTAGRLVRDKHFDDVLAAFQRVRARRRQASLLVLGDGPDRGRLERLAAALGISDAVSFLGHVPQTVVRDELGRARVFVTMSREEFNRLDNVIKEAMVSRCVPVVAATKGIDELVSDGVNGFVVRPGDVAAAANHVVHLIDDSVQADRMSALGVRRIRERFDARHTMTEYLARWTQLAEGRTDAASPAPAVPTAAVSHAR